MGHQSSSTAILGRGGAVMPMFIGLAVGHQKQIIPKVDMFREPADASALVEATPRAQAAE